MRPLNPSYKTNQPVRFPSLELMEYEETLSVCNFPLTLGRGIWRCLYDPNSSLLVTAGFDTALKAQQLQASLFESLERHAEEVKELTGRRKIFTVCIPHSSEHIGLMDSKSEYVRCLHFAREYTLYVTTNNGYVYHAKLSNNGDVKWTELVQVSEVVPIVCMDLLSGSSSILSSTTEDSVAVGDGKKAYDDCQYCWRWLYS
ncbi:transducin family protein [Actinidia rufa]|uniref:Transducin family protein n=1 Tax=Actinidia rufa TaxID=165716 RepID=A0A7J0H1L3_9ERIC|nr:transducin family protein [Actinidia rufa]